MLLPLTKVQSNVFVIIQSHIETFGYSPTMHEICEKLSRKNCSSEIIALEKKGWLTKATGRGIRLFEITDEANERFKNDSQLKLSI